MSQDGERSDPDQVRVLDAITGRSSLPVLEICRRSGLAPDKVSAILGVLELDGVVRRVEGGWRKAGEVGRRG